MFQNQLYTYSLAKLRNDKKFELLSFIIFLIPFISFSMIIIYSTFINLTIANCAISLIIAYSIANLIALKNKVFKYKLEFDLNKLKKLFFTGVPIHVLSILSTVLITVDRYILSWNEMFEIIGYFGFTMMIVNGIYSIPGSLASVLYPDMLEDFGKDKNASSLMDKIFPLLILTIITTSLITILFAAFLPLMINHFLIDYKDGQYLMTLILVTSIYTLAHHQF